MSAQTIIQILTTASLAGLLFEVGLRLTVRQILEPLKDRKLLARVLVTNFVLVPALAIALVRVLDVPTDSAAAILLLATAPFAPVVPVFAKMAKGDLALAASLTALFPLISAVLTPPVCALALRVLPDAGSLRLSVWMILGVLFATITLPLAAGVAFHHWWPAAAKRLRKPLEVSSETAGAISLGFVTFVEFESIRNIGWTTLLAVALLSEASLLAGYWFGGGTAAQRKVTALGASNRNIALALLVALGSFHESPAVPGVVAGGLTLIFLGLLHVAYWRVRSGR